jgi:WD40 repeat protein
MQLIWETIKDEKDQMVMMVCSNNNEYSVYDERAPDESVLLRQVRGGHRQEITIMAYDFHLSLIATGCINGEITLYDFEMSKNVGILSGHTENVTALKFLSPYPLLISASLDQTVCIWGVRGDNRNKEKQAIDHKYVNVCLKVIRNMSWNFCRDTPCTVLSIMVNFMEKSKGIRKYTRLRNVLDGADNLCRHKGNEFLQNITASCQEVNMALAFRNFEENFVFSIMPVSKMYETDRPPKNEYQRKTYKKFGLKQMHKKVLYKKSYLQVLAEEDERQQAVLDHHNKL